MTKVIVVGGGFSGLLVGAELKRRGADPLVLERSSRPGGVARTVVEDGFLLEPAAGSLLLPNADLTPILEAAGISFLPALDGSRTRFVYDRGRLFEMRESPALLFSRLVSWRAKFRAAREPWVRTAPPEGEESLLGFFTRRFGNDLGRLGADLMAHGVFAGDPAALSIQAAFPKLVDLEAEAGSVVKGALARRRAREKGATRASVHVAQLGMDAVAAELATYLGDGLRLDVPVTNVAAESSGWRIDWEGGSAHSDAVVIAVAPVQASSVAPGALAELLSDRPMAEVAVVGIGGRSESLRLPSGFGALMGAEADIRALGILFESQYAPGRAPAGYNLAKGIYGGAADPEILTRSDAELIDGMVGELKEMLGGPIDPMWSRVVRSSIPQYPIGHAAWMSTVDDALSTMPGLHVAGWGYRGIGISSLGTEAVRVASRILFGPAS